MKTSAKHFSLAVVP